MPSSTPTVIWNQAQLSHQRLHELLDSCNAHSQLAYLNGYNADILMQWKFSLRAAFREISPKLKLEEINKINDAFKRLNKLHIIRAISTPDGKIPEVNPKEFNRAYALIDKIEMYLRKKADERKLLIPDKDTEMLELDI